MYQNPESSYFPLVDVDTIVAAYESNKLRWQQHVAKKYSNKAAKAIASTAINQLTANTAAPIFGVPVVLKTKKHLQRLKLLRNNEAHLYPCHCINIEGAITCHDMLSYVIQKKQGKIYHKSLGSIPVLSTLETMRGVLKSGYKHLQGTKGTRRELVAKTLRMKARECNLCRATIAELLGDVTEQQSWQDMFGLLAWEEGWKIVFEKIAST